MIVYVLTRQYLDKSGFAVCGVTEKKDVAAAFEAGGRGTSPMPVVYQIDTEEPLIADGHPEMIGCL